MKADDLRAMRGNGGQGEIGVRLGVQLDDKWRYLVSHYHIRAKDFRSMKKEKSLSPGS